MSSSQKTPSSSSPRRSSHPARPTLARDPSASHASRARTLGLRAAAVRDLDAGLEHAVDVHEAPVVLDGRQAAVGGVVHDLPGLVEGLEPEVARAVCVGLADEGAHELVHLVDAADGAGGRVGAGHVLVGVGVDAAVVAVARGPADLGDDLLLGGVIGGEAEVVVGPEGVGPAGGLGRGRAGEEGVDVGHDDVRLLHHLRGLGPVVAEVAGRDGDVDAARRQVVTHVGHDLRELVEGEGLLVEELVADDGAGEHVARRRGRVEHVVELLHLPRVGRVVAAEEDAEPDLHRARHAQLLDGVQHHGRLVAVGAVQPYLGRQLAQHRYVHGHVVLARRIRQAVRVLRVDGRVVHAGEDAVQARVVHQGLDLRRVAVQVAGAVGGGGRGARGGFLGCDHGAYDAAYDRQDDDEAYQPADHPLELFAARRLLPEPTALLAFPRSARDLPVLPARVSRPHQYPARTTGSRSAARSAEHGFSPSRIMQRVRLVVFIGNISRVDGPQVGPAVVLPRTQSVAAVPIRRGSCARSRRQTAVQGPGGCTGGGA